MTKRRLAVSAWPTLALSLSFVLCAQLNVHAQACPVTSTNTGSIAAGDATQTGRVTRTGIPSDCLGKPYPGTFDAVPGRRFDQYTFTNTNPSAICVQVTLNGTIAGLHSVAYLNSFNPLNIQTNYVGDLGVIYSANTNASYSFSVPAGATFVVVVHETTAGGPTANYTLTVDCATPPPPQPTAGQLLISEFRLAGPGASGAGTFKDEFIELYNNTDGALTVGNYRLFGFDPNFFGPDDGADFFFPIPAGTIIPARGHLLLGDNSIDMESYSLTGYAALSTPYTCGAGCDFYIDNEGIQVMTPTAFAVQAVIDSVGFTGSGGRTGEVISYPEGTPLPRRTQVNPTSQYAYVRKMTTGNPQDTNNNANDFELVSVNGALYPLAAGGTQQSTLGAPGPENITSPIQRNALIPAFLLDASVPATSAPNRVRNLADTGPNKTNGTLEFRRRFTNNTGAPITRLRFRVVNITTFPTPDGTTADLRVLTSGDTTAAPVNDATTCAEESLTPPCTATVRGTTLEEPPTQTMGGGLNSSIIVSNVTTAPIRGRSATVKLPRKGDATIELDAPLNNGRSINVRFVVGVVQSGTFRFFVNVEALP